MKYTLKASLYLLARVILVCILSFLSIPMASIAPGIFRPILGIFYFSIMLYFFVFTMWYEGGKDINRINTEMVNKNLGKGFISASILTIPLCIINIVPLFFPSDLKNIFVTIFGVLKIIFSMSNIFTIQIFIN
ncbi:MAG: hypothetical protein K0S55_1207, partial [Clostridia bacterium]|nr:hypothetical protein [Clostridia bacterium]